MKIKIKMLESYIYNGMDGKKFHIKLVDKESGKVFCGILKNTYDSEKAMKEDYERYEKLKKICPTCSHKFA